MSGGSLFVLLVLTAVAAIILGMGMTTTAVYITVAALIVPALIKAGIEPMAAHLFAFLFWRGVVDHPAGGAGIVRGSGACRIETDGHGGRVRPCGDRQIHRALRLCLQSQPAFRRPNMAHRGLDGRCIHWLVGDLGGP